MKSLVHSYFRKNSILKIMLMVGFILFVIGVFAPILTFKRFFIFSTKISILSALFQLQSEGHFILFGIIFIFSIILPIVKMVFLYTLLNAKIRNRRKHEKCLHWIAQYGKWSMLDVLVAAMLIVTIRLGAIANVKVHFGLYAFAASVILIMLVTAKVRNLTNLSNRRL